MKDCWTKQRKQWINSVSPFHQHETQIHYLMWWVAALIFGVKMPHQRRGVA